MQDFFIYFTEQGKHCPFSDCSYNRGHYHCKFCPTVMKGLMTDKMMRHVSSKHGDQLSQVAVTTEGHNKNGSVSVEQSEN